MKAHPYGVAACIVGTVLPGEPLVVLRTLIGGKRIVPVPSGTPLPRIC